MFDIYVSPYCRKGRFKNRDVKIHDTTLREGEQAPGVIFSIEDKVRIAGMLLEIGVDRIEAGFPASTESEVKAVKSIVKEYGSEKVFGFSRAVKKDVDAVIDCECEGILFSFPPSDIHLKYKLRMTREQYLERAVNLIEYIKSHGLKIVYSAEDATRAEYDWLLKVFSTVRDAGAEVARVADTVGCITPMAMYELIKRLERDIGGEIEVHCHNDHGLALANSLAAFEAGATAISSSVLGLGERTGIAATEEVILSLNNLYEVNRFKTTKLTELCEFVSIASGYRIWPTKPVVGKNAFTHYSGIHQDGVLKNPVVYESFPPELVGGKRRILIGKVSGRAAIRMKLNELGITNISDRDLELISKRIKEISFNRRSAISDEELIRILKELNIFPGGEISELRSS